MQILLHGGVHFARVFFTYTHATSQGCLWSHMLLHRDIFTRRHLCTERNAFLPTNTFTERWFYSEQFAQKPKQTKVLLQRNACARRVFSYGHFHTDILLNYFLWRTRVWRKEFSKHMQNQFHHSFWWSRRISWERVGPGQSHIAIWPHVWRSTFRANGLRFVDINPCCPATRREKSETIKGVGVCKKLISSCVFTSATSHLHISTNRFQEKTIFRLHLNIFRTTPAYGIYSFGSYVKEDSVNLCLWICTSTPFRKIHACILDGLDGM